MLRSGIRTPRAVAWLLAPWLAALPCAAHEFSVTEARLWLRSDRTFQLDLRVDVDALALGVAPSTDSAEVVAKLRAMDRPAFDRAVERARETVLRRVRIRFDGEPARPILSFPPPAAASERDRRLPTVLGLIARLEGPIPAGAEQVTVFVSRAFGPVHLTLVDEGRLTGTRQLLTAGERSRPWPLTSGDRSTATPAPDRSGGSSVARYLALGFRHILPGGVDHILFVLGLFLFSRRLPPLLVQITAFTLAHTAALALAVYGIVSLPARWVETLIALSIAYVAFENVATESMTPWRPALVFGFGLLHGLGFAAVLFELGLPEGEVLAALIAFNIGVEAGQLAVVLLAFLVLGWIARRDWYRTRVVIPLSLSIGAIGLFWAFQRALG